MASIYLGPITINIGNDLLTADVMVTFEFVHEFITTFVFPPLVNGVAMTT